LITRGRVSAVAAVTLALVAVGCTTVRVPPALTADERSFVASQEPTGICAITDTWRLPPGPSNPVLRFAAHVRDTGLFREVVVRPVGDVPANAEWVVDFAWFGDSGEIRGSSCTTGPLILSLGLWPITSSGRLAAGFGVRRREEPAESARVVEFTFPTAQVLGWAGLPLRVLPDWTVPGENARERVTNRLALALTEAIAQPARGTVIVTQ
jgi:hypothetical protein